jgi:hypothetical protein
VNRLEPCIVGDKWHNERVDCAEGSKFGSPPFGFKGTGSGSHCAIEPLRPRSGGPRGQVRLPCRLKGAGSGPSLCNQTFRLRFEGLEVQIRPHAWFPVHLLAINTRESSKTTINNRKSLINHGPEQQDSSQMSQA